MKSKAIIFSLLFLIPMAQSRPVSSPIRYPKPKETRERLFYIQKSSELNTIVYDARFDTRGKVDASNPVNTYWLAFEENGQKKDLGTLERHLIYGTSVTPLQNSTYDYKVTLAATDRRHIYLKESGPYKVEAYAKVNGKFSVLDHVFIKFDDEAYFTRILYVDIYAKSSRGAKQTKERVYL